MSGQALTQPDQQVTDSEPTKDNAAEASERLPLDELQTFADVFYQIREGYVEAVDDSTLFEYAVKGMLEGLDPHSVYMTREDYSDLQTQNRWRVFWPGNRDRPSRKLHRNLSRPSMDPRPPKRG